MSNWNLQKEKNIFNLVKIFDEIVPLLNDIQHNREKLSKLIMAIGTYEIFLKHPQYDGHAQHLQNFIQAVVSKESDEKARLHFTRLRKVIQLVVIYC